MRTTDSSPRTLTVFLAVLLALLCTAGLLAWQFWPKSKPDPAPQRQQPIAQSASPKTTVLFGSGEAKEIETERPADQKRKPEAKVTAALNAALERKKEDAENWPNWRGPAFNGSSSETGLPDKLDAAKNLAWVCPMPGAGSATPAVWGERIFVSSPDKAHALLALCINRKDGQILWQKKLGDGDFRPNGGKNNMAAPSPVTDGQSAYFLYGTGDLAKLDNDGKVLWSRNLQKDCGDFTIMWGYGSSPLLYKDRLYVQVLRRGESLLLAIDPKNGKDFFNHVRPSDARGESLEAYSTPAPHEYGGKSEVVITGGDCMTGHDPETGAELWRFGGWNPAKINHWRVVTSAVAGDGLLFCAGPKRAPLFAVKDGGSGDVSKTNLAWKFTDFPPDVCTPLFYQNRLYVLDGDKKMLTCLDPQTGAKRWQGSLGGIAVFSCSPTAADGKIYCLSESGEIVVLSAGGEFKILSRLALEEGGGKEISGSSVAISQGNLFVRTAANLRCFKQ